jgi:hypothetical protein
MLIEGNKQRACRITVLNWQIIYEKEKPYFTESITYVTLNVKVRNIGKNRITKEKPKRQNWKCMIKPVNVRYWKVQVTVHAP